nr:hypothetical protein [Pontibacter sp. BAB1700]
MKGQLGADYTRFETALQQPAPVSIRLNKNKLQGSLTCRGSPGQRRAITCPRDLSSPWTLVCMPVPIMCRRQAPCFWSKRFVST